MSSATILISPLNWGLGHAGRMIPLALELKKRGNRVVFGADAQLLPLLADELPGMELIEIPGLRIRYSRLLPQYLCIFLQLPAVIISAFREHFALRRLAKTINPSVIISDNRFGFFHREIFSAFVTHQLRIPFPRLLRFMEPFAAWLHREIITNYDLCLVPDYPGEVNLSGRLSHALKLPENVHYAGPLSRLSLAVPSDPGTTIPQPYCCLILSGPEPQRTMLLERVAGALRGVRLCVLSTTPVKNVADSEAVKGGVDSEPVKNLVVSAPHMTCLVRPGAGTMRQIIEGSSLVITRAGYTSVMELLSLNRGAVLIPTPGQPEQEYLGEYLNGKYGFKTISQNDIRSLRGLVKEILADAAAAGAASEPTGAAPEPATATVPAAGTTAGQLPPASVLFEQAINLLLEQKKKR